MGKKELEIQVTADGKIAVNKKSKEEENDEKKPEIPNSVFKQ
jgi:hypothetical protein